MILDEYFDLAREVWRTILREMIPQGLHMDDSLDLQKQRNEFITTSGIIQQMSTMDVTNITNAVILFALKLNKPYSSSSTHLTASKCY